MSELKGKNITWTECKRIARNRTRWKALMEDLCSTKERKGQRDRQTETETDSDRDRDRDRQR